MPLSDYFKPDWKHTSVEIRLKSLERLKSYSNQTKAKKIIQKIALTDKHSLVKEKAITLLETPENINEIFTKSQKATQKEFLQLILEKIILKKIQTEEDALDLKKINPWLDIFTNEEHLKNLLFKTKNSKFKSLLINRINEFSLLYEIYLSHKKHPISHADQLLQKIKSNPDFKYLKILENLIVEYENIYNKALNQKNFTKNFHHTTYQSEINTLKQKWNDHHKKVAHYNIDSIEQNYHKISDKIIKLLKFNIDSSKSYSTN